MRSLFFFDTMLTPIIIVAVYWLGLLSVLLGGLGMIFSGSIMAGLGTLIGGAMAVRIWCELLIVIFKINENLHILVSRE